MYAPGSVATTNGTRSAFPLVAICCLGLLGFLFASTIILALIPIYLPTKDVTVSNSSANSGNGSIFYLVYEANGNGNSSNTGTIDNLSQIEQLLNQLFGVNNAVLVVSGQAQTAFVRRKRSIGSHRPKRDIKNRILLGCRPKFASGCTSPKCQSDTTNRVRAAAQNVKTLSNLPCRILSRQFGLTTVTFTYSFVGLTLTRPVGFGGEPSTLGIFVAVQSGEFNNPATWSQGIVPYGVSSIVISTGVFVTLSNTLLDLYVIKFDIYGTLALGSSANATFTFLYSTNVIIYSGGTLRDQTSNHRIYSPVGTLLTIYPGASFVGTSTVLITYTSLPAANSAGASVTLGSSLSGPFTCGVLSTTVIQTFSKVTFLVAQSGDFTVRSTWLGGVVPTADVCALVRGCGLFVSPGFTLSTAGLNNSLNINFNVVLVTIGSSLQIGTNTISGGFTFTFALSIVVQLGGTIQDQTTLHQFYLVSNSLVTLSSGASFLGVGTVITTYTSLPAVGSLGVSFTIGSSLSGPFTLGILPDGKILTFKKVTFLAIVSGDFTVTTTWLAGAIPTTNVCGSAGGCGVYVASGCVLGTAGLNNQLTININLITVASGGSLTIGTATLRTGFTFVFTINIIVQAGGQIQDQTGSHQFYCLPGSIITLYPGASFVGTKTEIFIYTSLPASASLGISFIFGTSLSGPFTFAILLDQSIETFKQVTFIVSVSGSFTVGTTWIGGIIPTQDVCALVGGCGLYIPARCTLSTTSLNGQLLIDFTVITIALNGVLQLGTAGVNIGFKFFYAVVLNCYGQLSDISGGNFGIFVPPLTYFNFFESGFFTAVVSTFLYTFNPLTGIIFGPSLILQVLINGPYYIFISITGVISVNTQGPGIITTTSKSPTMTTGFSFTNNLLA